jgi:hypothetical protein
LKLFSFFKLKEEKQKSHLLKNKKSNIQFEICSFMFLFLKIGRFYGAFENLNVSVN